MKIWIDQGMRGFAGGGVILFLTSVSMMICSLLSLLGICSFGCFCAFVEIPSIHVYRYLNVNRFENIQTVAFLGFLSLLASLITPWQLYSFLEEYKC